MPRRRPGWKGVPLRGNAVLSGALGAVHGLVGCLEERVGPLGAVAGRRRDAAAQPRVHADAVLLVHVRDDGLAHLLGDADRFLLAEAWQGGRELVAPEARREAPTLDELSDDVSRGTDDERAHVVAVRVVDGLHAVHVHDDDAERRNRPRRDRREARRELRVEAALHPEAAQIVDRDEALDLRGLRVPQGILLHLDDRLADEDAVAGHQGGARARLAVEHRPVGAPEVDERPVAVAPVLDPGVTPRHVLVAERQLARRVAPHVDRAIEDDARAHVGAEDDGERRRHRLADLALEGLAQAVRVVVERLGAQGGAPVGPAAGFAGIVRHDSLEATTRPRPANLVEPVIDDILSYASQLEARAAVLGTLCVHAGDHPDPTSHALEVPVVLSSAFGFASASEAADAFQQKNDAYIYGRWGNPTVEALEEKLAALEGTEEACATASGMAAVSGAVLSMCAQGDHVVAPRSMYAESARLLRERLPRFGIETTFVDASAPGAYEAALRPGTRVLYVETPANPNLAVVDIEAVVALAKARGLTTIADNTFATPFAQTPHALGVDVVVHSMTKALGGHGDAIGGCVCGRRDHVSRIRDLVVKGFGGVISPLTAFLVSRGLRTFALRQRQQCASAATLAERLSKHPRVAVVHHPSLASHPGHTLARRQMHAYGALLSFELRPGGEDATALDAGRRVLERVRTITHAVSLGDVRSLLVHPASTTHSTMPAEARAAANISDGLLRLSVGIEGVEDLWRDLDRALGR